MTSSQNHFGSTVPSQFNTKNNTRVVAQKGGLAILPCVVKVNSPATVRHQLETNFYECILKYDAYKLVCYLTFYIP